MFDIGFFELLVVAVVALLVIGPEQLPGALRTAGLWIGRVRRALAQTRTELEQQLGADDIRRQLHNEEVMRRLNATEAEIKRVVDEVASPDLASRYMNASSGQSEAAEPTLNSSAQPPLSGSNPAQSTGADTPEPASANPPTAATPTSVKLPDAP